MRARSKDKLHVAYDMFSEEMLKHDAFGLRDISTGLYRKGDKLESIRYEDLAALKNMVEMTGLNGDKVLFIGYSSERKPVVGVIKKGSCSHVKSYEVIGTGREYVEPYLRQNYRPEMSLDDAVTLVAHSLNLCLSRPEKYKGYQIAGIPNQLKPQIHLFQNLEAEYIDLNRL